MRFCESHPSQIEPFRFPSNYIMLCSNKIQSILCMFGIILVYITSSFIANYPQLGEFGSFFFVQSEMVNPHPILGEYNELDYQTFVCR